ncbi:Peptide chain release factor RF2 [Buchnera aphidicola (Neophyllaphis podocarpi)]|uniref:peptide chain release factor 2 n=1 Tax=Buchnera aphidicola TaxID=9 RepID=UPI003464428E
MKDIYIIKNKINYIKKNIKIIKKNLQINKKNKRLKKINQELATPQIWKNNKLYAKNLNKEKYNLEKIINKINIIQTSINDINDIIIFSLKEKDKSLLKETEKLLKDLEKRIKKIKIQQMFFKKNDKNNCYIDIQPGSGGIEAQDWAKMLLKMYLKWAENKNFKSEIIDILPGEIAGIKYATLKIEGKYAFGWMRTENGIHRLVRKSPFDSTGKRHTSFSSIFVYPDINNKDINIDFNLSDIRIDVYRASGAGGQHVNRTESAVRITHIPTGIVTQCQNDRSQHKNKETAIKQMKSKLYKLELIKKNIEKKNLEKQKSDIRWGNQIRSYILDDSRIKDIRTNIESRNIQAILNGELDIFILESLKLELQKDYENDRKKNK